MIIKTKNMSTIRKTITFTEKKHLKSLKGLKSIDIGCAVKDKSFYVNYNKDDSIFNLEKDVSLSLKEHNDIITQFYKNRNVKNIEFSKENNSLITFFLQPTRYLQQSIGTVAAIDLSEYAKSINFEIDEEI
jgi:hypothetical protein